MTHYPHLSSPIRLGNVTFRNRMFAAPMGGTDITADCSVGPVPRASMSSGPRAAPRLSPQPAGAMM